MLSLILLVVIFVLLIYGTGRVRARQKPVVAVTASNVRVRGFRNSSSVEWRDVRQIDVARMPTTGVEHFCVVLFGNNSLSVYDSYPGFAEFEAKMFDRWPGIRAEWTRVFTGPPDISERVTVWKQGRA
ncbi:MAG: hypothetical protein KGL29_13805 [Alphaproteobacteria bacterium]|nr:hypothetical protein [Alphaproteobacteria bacterium]